MAVLFVCFIIIWTSIVDHFFARSPQWHKSGYFTFSLYIVSLLFLNSLWICISNYIFFLLLLLFTFFLHKLSKIFIKFKKTAQRNRYTICRRSLDIKKISSNTAKANRQEQKKMLKEAHNKYLLMKQKKMKRIIETSVVASIRLRVTHSFSFIWMA